MSSTSGDNVVAMSVEGLRAAEEARMNKRKEKDLNATPNDNAKLFESTQTEFLLFKIVLSEFLKPQKR